MGATHFSGLVVSPTNKTASFTASEWDHAGKVVALNAAAGLTVTLPAASGSGAEYRFFIGTTVTSNDVIIQVASSTDTMAGVCHTANDTDASASLFETAATSDTITLDGSTTGGILGGFITLIDVASTVWAVNISQAATGSEATPFSAAV